MKNKNIIIVIACIAAALICVVLTFWGNWKNDGVLTTDAFVGIMATFIGVCATIIVGVQIVKHIEMRKMQDSIKKNEEEGKELKYQREAFSVEMYNTRLSIGSTLALMALMAKDKGDTAIEFTSLVYSVVIDDWSSMKGTALLSRYKRLADISDSVIQHGNLDYFEHTYKTLSRLAVPMSIEHYDEIMALHYKLLSELERHISKQSSETNSSSNK